MSRSISDLKVLIKTNRFAFAMLIVIIVAGIVSITLLNMGIGVGLSGIFNY